ncbi:response regulator transcription factor [Paenibacillus sediminis]|uniref:DNA-binding response OmpR family regulator n=1 Tax=Paenibacillus sediminis TaxID=664909 RepID=A0ABS4H159_9BACL|nr:response regulator transcription factor [Paenibacillus sediminis]MBP1936102.1 DNA-binding response OmpR family regulator [Paenibacillus sediminis]
MKHVFVVDDEKNIRDILKKYIESQGYNVTLFDHGVNVITEIGRLKPDLIVLDIMMPGIDGMELCREIRKTCDIPIIFVTAKNEEIDRVLGLEIGADDYLSKPFSPRELVARIKNIFRRLERKPPHAEFIELNDLTLHKERRMLLKDGQEIKLTIKEYELIEFMADHPRLPFTREQLTRKVWGYDYYGDERLVDDLVKRIRKKLSEHDSSVQITTVWGYGYRLDV